MSIPVNRLAIALEVRTLSEGLLVPHHRMQELVVASAETSDVHLHAYTFSEGNRTVKEDTGDADYKLLDDVVLHSLSSSCSPSAHTLFSSSV